MNDRLEEDSIPFCQGPNPDPGMPIHPPPPEAWDCHAHIFGPLEQYHLTANRSFTPPEASLTAYRRMLAAVGIAHAVIVPPSVYGTDNRCTFDSVSAAGGLSGGPQEDFGTTSGTSLRCGSLFNSR
ncbi:MAG: amidohydrolase family protein [Acidobacteriota bacterium]|nr:amidohydrolase family protein [Acidobacteriota bacterium]